MTGALVKIRPDRMKQAWYINTADKHALGFVLKGPVTFGFIDRCYVLWTSAESPPSKSWADLEDLEIIIEKKP